MMYVIQSDENILTNDTLLQRHQSGNSQHKNIFNDLSFYLESALQLVLGWNLITIHD